MKVSKHKNSDNIPCNPSLLVMGGSWAKTPTHWQTHQKQCQTCCEPFVVTATEQRFWYEEMGIPYFIPISDCLNCRKMKKNYRKLTSKLSEILSKLNTDNDDPEMIREAILTIAEGMITYLPKVKNQKIPILNGHTIAQKGVAFVNMLREKSARHDDLLPILILFHQRLGNQQRVERLNSEMETIVKINPVMAKTVRAVQTWLATPERNLRHRIVEPPRI